MGGLAGPLYSAQGQEVGLPLSAPVQQLQWDSHTLVMLVIRQVTNSVQLLHIEQVTTGLTLESVLGASSQSQTQQIGCSHL